MDALDILAIGLAAKGGGGGGTSDYSDLSNKPQINDVTLSGNKSLEDLGIPNYVAGDNVSITEDSEGNFEISATDTTYTAGTNIDITGGVISATDTTYTAGTGIDITSDVISIDNTVALKSDIPAAELPTITSSDAGKILKVNSNHDGVEWGSESTELPTITGNANKILKVNSGATAVEWASESTELPTISSGDAGKVLTVNSGETGVEWAAGGGGSSYTFTKGLTESSGTVSWDLNDTIKRVSNNSIRVIPYDNIPSQTKVNSNAHGLYVLNRNACRTSSSIVVYGSEDGGLINGYGDNSTQYHEYNFGIRSGSGCLVGGALTGMCSSNTITEYNPRICAGANGSIAYGVANGNGNIGTRGQGSIAVGYADEDASSSYNYTLKASGVASQAFGKQTRAVGNFQMVIGKNNSEDALENQGVYSFIIGNGASHSSRSNALTVDWTGNVVAAGTVTPSGSDYCEYFEFEDGNPESEDRMGMLVSLHNGKIVFANDGDDILGITTTTKGVIGDSAEMNWVGKYERDELGRFIYEDYDVVHEEGTEDEWVEHVHTKKISPNYDPSQEYIPRSHRKEWYPVGMLGKVYVKYSGELELDDYITADEGIAVKSESKTNMRVLEIVNDHVARVLIK